MLPAMCLMEIITTHVLNRFENTCDSQRHNTGFAICPGLYGAEGSRKEGERGGGNGLSAVSFRKPPSLSPRQVMAPPRGISAPVVILSKRRFIWAPTVLPSLRTAVCTR